MKRYSISRYKLGKDPYVPMPVALVRRLVEEDPDLHWYEDVDDYYRERQKQREKPAVKISFVFNYQPPPGMPAIHATFMEGADELLIKVNHSHVESLAKLREIADKLEANLYKT